MVEKEVRGSSSDGGDGDIGGSKGKGELGLQIGREREEESIHEERERVMVDEGGVSGSQRGLPATKVKRIHAMVEKGVRGSSSDGGDGDSGS